jgi:hypothetical protein
VAFALALGLCCAHAETAAAQTQIDMKDNPFFKKQLDAAVDSVKKHLVKEAEVAGITVRIDLGNEGNVSVKSAKLNVEKAFPLKGRADLVFDLHFRHVTMKETVVAGVKIPAIVAYDRHEDLMVEYDINDKKARARVLKGPFKLPPLPEVEYEVWITLDLRDMK